MLKLTVKKKTVLIFGISSFVGSNLATFFKNEFKVVGTYHKNKIDIDGVLSIPCDVLKKEQVRLTMLAFKPDIAIYCVGNASIYYCSENSEVSDALNTGGLVNVIDFSQRYKTQVCLVSSANVFSGDKLSYSELDIPDPSTIYGKQMASSEFYLQKNCLNYLIFRTCKLYGHSYALKSENIFEKVGSALAGGSVNTFDNRIGFGWLDILFLCSIMKNILKKEPTNRLFQVSSTDVKTMYEFATTVAKINQLDAQLISKGRVSFPMIKDIETKFDDGHEQKYCLETGNIESYLNFKMPSIEESLILTKDRFNGT
jgi:dTDP-4-dehydrorhamnose reductase